jgi:hypothetical protein
VAARPQWRRAQELLRAQMSMADWNRMFAVFRTITTATERVRQRSRSRRMPSKIVPRRADRPTL